jgi:septum formation protein
MSVRFTKRWFRKKRIILASGSPRRKELMDLTGLKYQVISPSVDEKIHPEETPRDHVERLAREKAISVAANNPDDVVIGCDTVVILNSRHILGKPQKKKDAALRLSGTGRASSVW